MRIVHVINGLGIGGAERSLIRLLTASRGSQFAPAVISLLRGGHYASAVRELDVPLLELDLKSHRALLDVSRARSFLREFKPRILQGWMYHGSIAARIFSWRTPLISCIRTSIGDSSYTSTSTKGALALLRAMQSQVDLFAYVSEASRVRHEARGFPTDRGVVVHSGFDAERFQFLPERRAALRREFGIPEDAIVLGHVGRFHPVKNQAAIVEAFIGAARFNPNLYLIGAGEGLTLDNDLLGSPLRAAGLEKRARLLGVRNDVSEIYSSMDIFVNASFMEGFPNAVAEAMLCQRVVVASLAGDTDQLIATSGFGVPPGDGQALSAAVRDAIEMSAIRRAELGIEARNYVVKNFSVEAEAAKYAALYRRVPVD